MQRIGVFGGTFDPIHRGHLQVAGDIRNFFALDQLLLIPAYSPPHKDPHKISDTHHRYAMIVLATAQIPALRASLIEIERPDLPYSIETIQRVKERYGLTATELYFIIGADSFKELPTWREPARLIENSHLIVTSRPGYSFALEDIPPEWRQRVTDYRGRRQAGPEAAAATRIYLTDLTKVDLSATSIRERVRQGQSVADLVPTPVADYIEKYQLYRTFDEERADR